MDVDYRALSNAGLWFVGRLQTDADRERVVEGMVGATEHNGGHVDANGMAQRIKQLNPRWFVVRDVHATPNTYLLNTRTTLSWLRGPMTRNEIRIARAMRTREAVTVIAPAEERPSGEVPVVTSDGDGAESASG